jgi:Uma2 family endonuclease
VASQATTGYTVEDLAWLGAELGIAHVELDPWGSVIVTPASDEQERALARLVDQVVTQLRQPGCVLVNGLAWKVPSGSGYVNVPDLAVVAPEWQRVGDYHLEPPPLLIIEIASPSTRAVDRGRKLSDYQLGGAGLYVLVDLPQFSGASQATFDLYDFRSGATAAEAGAIDLVVKDAALHLDLR